MDIFAKVKNAYVKKGLALVLSNLLCAAPSFAENYNVNAFGNTADSFINHLPSYVDGDVVIFTQNLASTVSIGSLPTITINGNRHSLSGSSLPGFVVQSSKGLTIKNFGSFHRDSNGKIAIDNTINNFGSTTDGGVVKNEGLLNISNSMLQSNNAKAGGVLSNSGTANIKNSILDSNSAESAGVIKNTGELIVTDSAFTNNSATAGNGGGVDNTATASFNNVKFKNNSSAGDGGAISNSGIVNISAKSGVSEFSGNTANGLSNAIHNTGTVNFELGKNGYIKIDDKITSSSINNLININKSGTISYDALGGGGG